MSDEDTLRRAAAKVREMASAAMAGPWESLDKGDRLVAWREGPSGHDDDFEYVVDEPIDHAGNAAWMAFVNPDLAEPLAAWLVGMALRSRGPDSDDFGVDYALAVARALLGEQAPA